MKKIIVLLLALSFIVAGILWAQRNHQISLDERWKLVEQFAEKQLPESALKEVDAIVKQAQKENNSQEQIKALLYKMRFTHERNPDKTIDLIREFETFTFANANPVEKALLLSMTAELYLQYYQNNAWNINSRTELEGYTPEEMDEWTKNIFVDKIVVLIESSLAEKDLLQKTDVLVVEKLIMQGSDSRELQPTLYDFLSNRALHLLSQLKSSSNDVGFLNDNQLLKQAEHFVQIAPSAIETSFLNLKIVEIYQQLLSFRLIDGKISALIWIDLERLKFVKENAAFDNVDEEYLKTLKDLYRKYGNEESVVEIIAEISNYYVSKSYEGEENVSFKQKAFQLTQEGIQKYPNYKRIALLHNVQQSIQQKELSIEFKQEVTPGAQMKLVVNSKNIDELKVELHRIDADALTYYHFLQNRKSREEVFSKRSVVQTLNVILPKDENFNWRDTSLIVNAGDYGIYEWCVTEKGGLMKSEVARGAFTVTDLVMISRSNQPNIQTLYVLDRKTGWQQEGVEVTVVNQKWKGSEYAFTENGKVKTDKNGWAVLSNTNDSYNDKLFLSKGADSFYTTASYDRFFEVKQQENSKPKLSLFTDRSLYRPGQSLYFKGIAYYADKKREHTVDAGESYEVTLLDANHQKVSSKKYKTNEFGSFSGEFVLPEAGLNGVYTIRSGNFSQTFWVEEYKRPTFEVKIDKPKAEIRFGEEVAVLGNVKAFAGFAVGTAKIKYRVVQRSHRFSWWWRQPDKEVLTGTAVADADGNFTVTFTPEKSAKKATGWRGEFYTYTVYTDVTDSKGETQQGEQSISVGDKSLFIITQIPEKFEKNEALIIDVKTETLNGENVVSVLNYEVFELQESTDFVENVPADYEYKTLKKIVGGTRNTNDGMFEIDASKWKSGQYRMVFTTKDNRGNEVKSEHIFVLYDKKDRKPAVKSYEWIMVDKTELFTGEKSVVRFGTSAHRAKVLYELMQGNKVLESRWVNVSNEILDFPVVFQESYGAGVKMMFTFVKDERLFRKEVNITRKTTERKLTPNFSVFRDKLKPGENAEWTVTIPESANGKVAELLIGMYDASLDAIRPHTWSFNPFYKENKLHSPGWSSTMTNYNRSEYAHFAGNFKSVYTLLYDAVNWFGFDMSHRSVFGRPIRIRGAQSLSAIDDSADVMEDISVERAMSGKVAGLQVLDEEVVVSFSQQKVESQNVQVRTNFNETAFFYPQLRTDVNGNVKVTFTAPESLTRWNVKMIAHTADLFVGLLNSEVVTQKELMVQMNLPRFVRRSDKLRMSASVTNLTASPQEVSVNLELINPSTNKNITLKDHPSKAIFLSAGQTASVEWELDEFKNEELVTLKVIAQAGSFSDGEQKYLPVLPDQILVTESLPLHIRANQKRMFTFESLLKNVEKVNTQNFTIEFASNPAWYAVQALPTLATPQNESALDYFTAYYANSLAGYLATSKPGIASVFQQWKSANGNREALLSNLNKNAELKNMLLDETPWVMAAKNETEQKRQIALLFDVNMQKNQQRQYLDKLLKLQSPNGGFAWYEGMPVSRYITMEIMLNLARLNRMTGSQPDEDLRKAMESAMQYLDLQLSKDFSELKKSNKNYKKEQCVGNVQLFYLHVRSEYAHIPIHKAAQEAFVYYTEQSEKFWTSFTLYGKAMMAVVAHRNGKKQIAGAILKSLSENALKTDEMGMYWARNTAGYFWSERPVNVHAAIIEAFAEIAPNNAQLDEMKIWLLKQKQTQRWDSPIASVNAVYALLMQGSDWLGNNESARVKLGDMELNPQQREAGTGYFKESFAGAAVNSQMGKITVTTVAQIPTTTHASSIGWGAAYWQYFQDIKHVEGQKGALSVSKKLFVEKQTSTGKAMLPIEQAQLKKGDKVITRLVVTADRHLEFVALKDLRAACFEPVNQRSGYVWKENTGYYQTTKDASTQFFFNFLPKGTYVFEYELWVNNSGEFTSGIASIQCHYAPEFGSHTGGEKIVVVN